MTIFFDIETTGLDSASDKVIEIAAVNHHGEILFDELIDPGVPISSAANRIHGITPDMLADKRSLVDVMSEMRSAFIDDGPVIIYNKVFDMGFFPGDFWEGIDVRCAMVRFRELTGKRANLATAADAAGHVWSGEKHRALADAMALQSVWIWLEEKQRLGAQRHHNLDIGEVAREALELNKEIKSKTQRLNELKTIIRDYASGMKLKLSFGDTGTVNVGEPMPRKVTSILVFCETEFEQLSELTKRELFECGVVASILEFHEAEFEQLPEPTKRGLFERGIVERKEEIRRERAAAIRLT